MIEKIQTECQQYFKRIYSLIVPEDWLNQCIEFILEENPV